MIDLDKLEQAARDADNPSAEIPRTVLTLVAELRAAREVVNQARLQSRPHVRLRAALNAYDQAVES